METSNLPVSQSEQRGKRRGIYFLANDRVYELTVAFLNSLRLTNPEIEVCLIPYNSDCEHIKGLRGTYNFLILDDDDTFRWCDDISIVFHKEIVGHYRKLAAWTGPFDEFIYIDIDTIVLADLNFCFGFLREYDFVSAHSNVESSRKWVWKESVFQSGYLQEDQIHFATNTGFLISRIGALHRAATTVAAQMVAATLIHHMELFCREQPFLNYLIVSSGRPYTSLRILHYKKGLNIPLEVWAGIRGGVVEEGRISFENLPGPLFVHWAGEWQPRKPGQTLNPDMPYRSFWEYYRKLRDDPAIGTIVDGRAGKMEAAKILMEVDAKEPIAVQAGAVALSRKVEKLGFAWEIYNKPKVAVVITHYNYSHFVEAAIDSVLHQTYDNFEVIVIDDFSDHNHSTRLREILARKPGVKAIWNTTNIGQILSFYRAVEVSQANFFCVLDPDDRYLPSFLEEMVSIHLNPYAFAGMACCDQLYMEHERQSTGVYIWQKSENAFRGVDVTAQVTHTMKLYNWHDHTWPWSSTSAMMFRRSVVSLLHPHRNLDYKGEIDSYLASGARYLRLHHRFR